MSTTPPFTGEHLKFDWPLTPESVVLDCGAYEGNFSREIAKQYGCRVVAFEPVRRFFDGAGVALKECPTVELFHAAIGAKTEPIDIHVQGDSTGVFATSAEVERVDCLNLVEMMDALGVRFCDLLKLNIEGSEFPLLEMLLADPHKIRRFGAILCQFHRCAPMAEQRYALIYQELTKSHVHLWGEDAYVWQAFALKK